MIHAHRRGDRALIDISLFKELGFTASAVTNLTVAVALFGVLVLLPGGAPGDAAAAYRTRGGSLRRKPGPTHAPTPVADRQGG